MKLAILSLIAALALAITAETAEARPPRGRVFAAYPSVNSSPYARGFYPLPSYNYGYPAGYYNYGSGFNFNIGGIGVSVGNYAYPSYYGGFNNFYTPYYGGWSGYPGRRW